MSDHKSVILLLSLLALVGVALAQLRAQGTNGEEVLTNEAIVKMVQAHLGVDVIVEQIRNSPGNYSLTTNSLIKLKQQGVPDKIIAGMQAKAKVSATSPPPASAPQAVAPTRSRPEQVETSSGHWQVTEKPDPMTGRVTREALISLHGSDEGDFRLSASCVVDQVLGEQFRSADLEIKSLTKGLGFQRFESAQTVTSRKKLFSNDVETAVGPALQCTWMDVGIGGGAIRNIQSHSCAVDSVASLELIGYSLSDVNEVADNVILGKDDSPMAKGLMGLVKALAAPQQAALDASTIHIHDLLTADSMKVGLSLTDGEKTVLQIPLDSVFISYVTGCLPPPHAPVAANATPPTAPAPASLAPIPKSPSASKAVTVPGNHAWTPTGVLVNAGGVVTISATGGVSMGAGWPFTPPVGRPPNCDTQTGFPAGQLPCWSLIGRIGEQGTIFYVGNNRTLQTADSGQLFLGVNDNRVEDNRGSWRAVVSVQRENAQTQPPAPSPAP
jgi:hypothetical protein